jgi:hypothetical protein
MGSHWDGGRYQSPCFCGKGQLFVVWDSENYPPFRERFYPSIECERCAREYHLAIWSLTDIRITKLSDHAARAAAVAARNAIWDNDSDVLALRTGLRAKLDALPSQAARHRWLREHGLYEHCLAKFRRDYRDRPDQIVTSIVMMREKAFPSLAAARQRRDTVAIPEVPVYPVDGIKWKPCEEVEPASP